MIDGILGLDVSSVAIGVSVLNKDTKEILVHEVIELDGMEWHDRIPKTHHYFTELAEKFKIVQVFIEEPLTKTTDSYSAFHTSAVLQMWAGSVHGMCLGVFSVIPQFINVRTARGFYKIPNAKPDAVTRQKKEFEAKENVFQFLVERGYGLAKELNRNGNVRPTTYDKSDALLIALCGSEGCESKEFVGVSKSERHKKVVSKLRKRV